MPYPIDSSTYPKATTYPLDHGYSLRNGIPSSIVVHSTEGAIGQTFPSAANYLYTQSKVSAHFLIGRSAEIAQFLDPTIYAAWHAGTAQDAYLNHRSIGIECLHANGENWPAAQWDALAWLLQQITREYAIPATMVDTHGQVATPGPYDRKVDPTNWPHQDFIYWRDAVLAAPVLQTVFAGPYGAIARQDYRAGSLPAAYFAPGLTITIDDFHKNEYRHAASGIGFLADGDLVF